MQKLGELNALEAKNLMENMISGTYEDISHNSRSRSCIICNIGFEPLDPCHLTNECVHLFHSEGLTRWYGMIARSSEYSCPAGNTKNHEVTQRSMFNDFGGVQFDDDIISDNDFQKKNLESIIDEEKKIEQ